VQCSAKCAPSRSWLRDVAKERLGGLENLQDGFIITLVRGVKGETWGVIERGPASLGSWNWDKRDSHRVFSRLYWPPWSIQDEKSCMIGCTCTGCKVLHSISSDLQYPRSRSWLDDTRIDMGREEGHGTGSAQ
jgi:hypothetical protein